MSSHESTHAQQPESNPTPPLSSQEFKKSETHHDETVSASPEEDGKGGDNATAPPPPPPQRDGAAESGRERLKRHRVEMAGRVWIPDMWGQEDLLKDWIDCAAFDASLVGSSILMARDSLAQRGRRPNSTGLKIQN